MCFAVKISPLPWLDLAVMGAGIFYICVRVAASIRQVLYGIHLPVDSYLCDNRINGKCTFYCPSYEGIHDFSDGGSVG